MSAAVALLQLQTTNLTRLPRPLTGPRNDMKGEQVILSYNDMKSEHHD